jgi:hypothetical protein
LALSVAASPIMLHAGPALAQESGKFAEVKASARAAFSEGKYDEAALLFREAFDLEPVGSLLYNIGLCYEKTANIPSAIVFYERFVTAMPGSPQRAAVQGKIGELKQSLEGQYETVSVESAPPGAVVFVDDKGKGAMGTTPLDFKLLPGTYNIIVELKGYEPVSQRLDLRKGQNGNVSARMVSSDRVGAVRLFISESGAQVKVDGKLVGNAPLPEPVRLASGKHQIEVIKPGFGVFSQLVEVQSGGEQRITVDLSEETGGGDIVAASSGGGEIGGGGGGGDGKKTKILPWIVVGVGVAAIGGGVVTGLSASSLHDQLTEKRANGEAVAPADVDTGNSMVLLTNVLMGAGAAIARGGVAWWLFDGGPLDRSGSTSLGLGTTPEGGSSVSLMGTF